MIGDGGTPDGGVVEAVEAVHEEAPAKPLAADRRGKPEIDKFDGVLLDADGKEEAALRAVLVGDEPPQ